MHFGDEKAIGKTLWDLEFAGKTEGDTSVPQSLRVVNPFNFISHLKLRTTVFCASRPLEYYSLPVYSARQSGKLATQPQQFCSVTFRWEQYAFPNVLADPCCRA